MRRGSQHKLREQVSERHTDLSYTQTGNSVVRAGSYQRWLSISLFATALSNGQTALTLGEAVRQAVENHPALQASRFRVAAAEGTRLQSGLKPNPRLYLQSENTRLWGPSGFSYPRDTDNFNYLSQVFETSDKRQRRIDYASTQVRRLELERDVAALQIAGRVARAYWLAVTASELRDVLRQDLTRYDEVVAYHKNRVLQGAAAEIDLLRVTLERDRLSGTLRAAEQDAITALFAVSREMGLEMPVVLTLTDRLSLAAEVAPPAMADAVSNRPEVKLAHQGIAAAEANERLQRANASPDPEVLFGYKRTVGINTLIAGIQINVPFRNRNQGGIAAAQAEARSAEYTVSAAERQVRHEIESAYAELEARRRILTESIIPMRTKADEIARISTAAYREGGLDLLRVIDAERVRLEAAVAYFRALGDYQQSLTMFRIAQGQLP